QTSANLAGIEPSLDQHRLRPCGPIEMMTRGFVSPFGRDSDELAHRVGDFTLLAVGGEDKLLPSSVVNDELANKLAEIVEKEERRIGAKERKRLKDEVLTDLLPRAFVRTSRQFAYLDLAEGWIVIDTASRKNAEEVVSQIRDAAARFPATPLAPEESPRALLTQWLASGQLPPNLVLGDECELRDPAESGAIVRCRRQDLELDEIKEHLKTGKQVFQLGLEFDERMSFVLGEDLVIRKLRFLDIVLDEIDESSLESNRAELDATFTLMTLEIRRLLAALESWFTINRPTDQA
ncbi:MAG: recombination-associated protein RdgC, partial [Dokdonella sp.]